VKKIAKILSQSAAKRAWLYCNTPRPVPPLVFVDGELTKSLKAMLVKSPPVGRAHDPLSRNLYQRSGGGTGRGADDYRRRFAAVFCAGLVMATGLPALAGGTDGSAGGSTSARPTAEAAATDQSFPQLHPNTAVQWVGMFGVLLLLARGAFRR
jgi:hypothetical protein